MSRVGVAVLALLLVLAPVTAALVAADGAVFEYDEGVESTATGPVGGVYHHEVSMRTDANEGPIVMTVYYSPDAPLSFDDTADSARLTLGGDPLDVRTNVTNVSAGSETLRRGRGGSRSPPRAISAPFSTPTAP